MAGGEAGRGVTAVDAGPAEAVGRLLRECCASPAWVAAVLAGRPYGDRAVLAAASDAAVEALPWPEVERALAAHPRIGERPDGDGRDAGWSRAEQSGVGSGSAASAVRAALAAGNAAYEARFGHVYLVRAAGRSAPELLALLESRLGNDVATERAVVRRELAEIARLRLDRLVAGGEP
ncbi:MAG TPA: 2-oxo-4-hydroxy-4-carboxy-5-ureidoimidazoline decarboxylase [Mycobacteriales bacterium]